MCPATVTAVTAVTATNRATFPRTLRVEVPANAAPIAATAHPQVGRAKLGRYFSGDPSQ